MSTGLDLEQTNISEWLTDIFGGSVQMEVFHRRPWSDVYSCIAIGKRYWIKKYKRSFLEHKHLNLLQTFAKLPEVNHVNEQLNSVVYKDLGTLYPITNEDVPSVIHEYLKLQILSKSVVQNLTSNPMWLFNKKELSADLSNEQSFKNLDFTPAESLEIVSIVKDAIIKLDKSEALESFVHTVAHGDLHADNIFLDNEGSVIFLDWADSGTGYLGSSLESLALDLDDLVTLINIFKEEFKDSIHNFENEFTKKNLVLKFTIGHLWRIKDFLAYRNLSLEEQQFIRERIRYCCSEIKELSQLL